MAPTRHSRGTSRRVTLTIRQIRALNAISGSRRLLPRFCENTAASNSSQRINGDQAAVSSVSVYQLSSVDVSDRSYRRLMAELREHGYVTEAGVPISVVQALEPDSTINETSISSSSDNDDEDDDRDTAASASTSDSSSDASTTAHSSSSAGSSRSRSSSSDTDAGAHHSSNAANDESDDASKAR